MWRMGSGWSWSHRNPQLHSPECLANSLRPDWKTRSEPLDHHMAMRRWKTCRKETWHSSWPGCRRCFEGLLPPWIRKVVPCLLGSRKAVVAIATMPERQWPHQCQCRSRRKVGCWGFHHTPRNRPDTRRRHRRHRSESKLREKMRRMEAAAVPQRDSQDRHSCLSSKKPSMTLKASRAC